MVRAYSQVHEASHERHVSDKIQWCGDAGGWEAILEGQEQLVRSVFPIAMWCYRTVTLLLLMLTMRPALWARQGPCSLRLVFHWVAMITLFNCGLEPQSIDRDCPTWAKRP